jgi:hypothetical protein
MKCLSVCGAVAFCVEMALGASLTPYGLECEARKDPVGIDISQPRFAWKLRSAERGQKQSAYQLWVASSAAKLAAGQADLWDSGRVNSDETASIRYAGAPLRSFQLYWWKVRTWDIAGQASDWSEPARFTSAVVDAKDWRESWIGYRGSALDSGPLPIFRKEIQLDRPLHRALAVVSGLGFYELRVNGAKVGDELLAPAWTNYRTTVLYETFDVTSNLKPGANAVAGMLGNGFYNVVGGRYVKFTASFGRPRFFLRLHLEFEDGSTSDIFTDRTWKTHQGPITFSCIYGGEDFDARLEPEGWDRPGFDDSQWPQAAAAEAPGGTLSAQSSPPIRVQQTFTPVRVTQPKPGIFVYDLGQNFSGLPAIEVSGAALLQVKLTPGELLDTSGLVSQRSSGGPVFFTYTLRGAGREGWSPRFSYYGFRYVQVEGAAPEAEPVAGSAVLHRLEGRFIHIDAARTGRFHCSNELFNKIYRLIDAAMQSNLQHVLTDCPHREKLGWLEVSYLMAPSLLYSFDLRTWLPKAIRDIREAQTGTGMIPAIAPEYHTFRPEWRDLPEWGSAGVMLPWLAWQWYGDRQPLDDSYPSMKRYMEYLDGKTEDHLLKFGLGDWYDIGAGAAGRGRLTPLGITASTTYFAELRTLESAAALLGLDAEARKFGADAKRVREAFQAAFYQTEPVSYATGSQTALAMPVVLGLAPESARTALIDKMAADIRLRNNHTSAGEIGFPYVVRALLDAGHSDTLFDMTNRTDAPSYGAQLAGGATSLTEAWDARPSASQNHLMLGHIEEWFFAGLAGIRPDFDTPGLRRVRIQPEVVGDLVSAEGSWDTFRGPVAVSWRIDQQSLKVSVEIPPGMTGEISLPAAQDQVWEAGVPSAKARQLRFVRQEGPRSLFEAVSGHYEFEVRQFRH